MARLDELLEKMVASKASDLHLSSGEPVRMRIDGELLRVGERPLEDGTLSSMMKEICRSEQWDRFSKDRDLDFAYGIRGVGRFRCNYLVNHKGKGAIFRVIPEEILGLEDLGMPPAVFRIPAFKRGLVLVTGPTGSGKSTTLAAMIDRINEAASRHIVTIEDPIEFMHRDKKSYVVHREIGQHAPTFGRALRDALLQDPDIILVGEMRDLETMSLAITAAEMGILVFATLHTNSAAKTFDRIVDTFPRDQKDHIRGMISESLRAIVAQQLVRRKDGKGRVAAVEVLLGGPGMANIIRGGNASKILSYIESHRGVGMQTMDESLQDLVTGGKISAADAYMKCSDKTRFEEWMSKSGLTPGR